mgnify:CR=1 FL=1
MAITAAALQAAADSANTLQVYRVLQGQIALDATYDAVYVDGLQTFPGRSMWVCTTKAGNAAAQHAEVLTALGLGPFDSNVVEPTN